MRAPAPPSVSSGTCWPEGRGCHPIDSLPEPPGPRPRCEATNPRVATAPLLPGPSFRALLPGRLERGAEAMALWALLSPGVLVRTGHTVMTWGITLVLFLHDTGEPDTARPRIPHLSPGVGLIRFP